MASKHDELLLDHAFWAAISTNRNFFDWFAAKSKFAGLWLDLDRTEKWHQRWFRDPETGLDSETDIALFLVETHQRKKFAIHIENKPPHGRWQPNQPENYERRAANRMRNWGHDDYQTALLAPDTFIRANMLQAGHFGFCVSYEDVASFIHDFAISTPSDRID